MAYRGIPVIVAAILENGTVIIQQSFIGIKTARKLGALVLIQVGFGLLSEMRHIILNLELHGQKLVLEFYLCGFVQKVLFSTTRGGVDLRIQKIGFPSLACYVQSCRLSFSKY
jgi:hypothetical protein